MIFDKKAYMREYMRNRRAGKPTPYAMEKRRADGAEAELIEVLSDLRHTKARADRMAEALTWIIKRLEGNQKPLAVELRDASEKALKIYAEPLDTSK